MDRVLRVVKSLCAIFVIISVLISTSACSLSFIGGADSPPDNNSPDSPLIPDNPDTPSEEGTSSFDKEEELMNYEHRFDKYEELIGKPALDQVKRLYSLYDDSVYEWIANLWDDEVGGFYYANSGRDFEGFLPDIESTRQALAIIRTSGMVDIYGDNVDEAFVKVFPKEYADKIVAFVKKCQDPDTGYFYHEQWGENVGAARLGRDLDQAITLLTLFGAKPDYPTALDRLSGAAGVSLTARGSYVSATSVVERTSSGLPEHLKSKEAFKAYLDTFDFVRDSHNNGHVVASQSTQIKAAGLIDFACDYFDAIQEQVYQQQIANGETPSGLWQPEINYTSVSGLYKIGGLYKEAGRGINHLDECVRSCIEAVKLNVEPADIIYVFNPWAGMNTAISAMKRVVASGNDKYSLEATHALVRSELSELVRITVDKLLVFQKESGGFSYTREFSAPTTQGTPVSLGLREGDLNATNIAVNSISSHIFYCAGLNRPDIWNFEDFDNFIDIMKNLEPIEKQTLKNEAIDFEDCEIDETPLLISATSPSGTKIDPSDPYNKALYLYSPAGSGTRSYLNMNLSGSFTCAVFEADIKMTDGNNGVTHQIKFQGTLGNMYMITLKYDKNKNTLTLGDNSHHTSGIVGELSVPMTADTWNRLRFEIYANSESEMAKDGFIVKVFLNGEFAAYSTNYFGPSHLNADAKPNIGFSKIEIYGMGTPMSELWLDNIFFEYAIGQIFEEEID